MKNNTCFLKFRCPRSSNIIITITFFTDNNVTILNILFQTLANLVSKMGITLESFNKCGTNEIGN